MEEVRKFQLHFGKQMYDRLYDESKSQYYYFKNDKQIYTVQNRGDSQKFIAKKYTIMKNQFIENSWKEIQSIIQIKDHQNDNVIQYKDIFLYDMGNECEIQCCIIIMDAGDMTLEDYSYKYRLKQYQQQEIKIEEETVKKNCKMTIENKMKQQYEDQVYQYFRQTLKGFKFLKENNIYHRDYKPQNLILLDNKVKIIDFDIVNISQLEQTQLVTGLQGTYIYMDPNLWNAQPVEVRERECIYNYNIEKSDIFSLGMTFLKVALAWDSNQLKQFKEKINCYFEKKQLQQSQEFVQEVTGDIWNEQLKFCLQNMLLLDIKQRWGLDECIQERKNQNNNNLQQQEPQLIQQVNNKDLEQQIEQQNLNITSRDQCAKNNSKVVEGLNFDNSVKLNRNNNQSNINVSKNIEDINLGNPFKIVLEEGKGQKILEQSIKRREDSLKNVYIEIGFYEEQGKQQYFKLLGQFLRNQQNSLKKLEIFIGHVIIHQKEGKINEFYQKLGCLLMEVKDLLLELNITIGINNNLGERGAQEMAGSIMSLTSLQNLSVNILDQNKIGTKGAMCIGECILGLNQQLRKLQLGIFSGNQVQQDGYDFIMDCIGKMTKLKEKSLRVMKK